MSQQRQQERDQQNQQIDAALDNLVAQTGQLNQNASEIGNQLDDQIKQTKDINNHMDGTQNKIDKAVIAVGKIKTTWDAFLAWILSILFLIATIIVWVKL